MFEKLLDPYKILDRLAVTKKPCTIVADADILEAVKHRQSAEGARLIPTAQVLGGKSFTPQPGPYFVVTARDEHNVKRRLRNMLARNGIYPEIYGALHDLAPHVASEHGALSKSGMDAAYEALLTQPAFAIACTPRSGSQHLAREMRNHALGHPLEHVRPPVIELMKPQMGTERFGGFDFVHWLASLVRYGTENGVFGTKLISHFLRDIDTHATPFERAAFDAFLKRLPVIYLLRGNKMMQALSRDRAKATRNYHLFDEQKREQYREKSQQWDYSFERLSQEIRALYQEERYLHDRLLQTVSPERMMLADYENLDLSQAVGFVETQLKVTAGKRQEQQSTNVLRDDLTKSYAEAFCRDYAAAYKADDPETHLPHLVKIDPESFDISAVSEPDTVLFQ
ncbi:Stf0 sulfotransferase family protein [Salipiger sp. P9]|uniref:Stf0 sulfotransferase family protein n=1 Tax=Salipiger pentaromativorans TaxID=2943193 RepID=UPI0021580F36|nr:Stf0 sulfotransferase family protein [Salipiger pentaromativorans]MCR8550888.1 Stf0 sulfotransferase family protein [Salipiger pentaromativorans]